MYLLLVVAYSVIVLPILLREQVLKNISTFYISIFSKARFFLYTLANLIHPVVEVGDPKRNIEDHTIYIYYIYYIFPKFGIVYWLKQRYNIETNCPNRSTIAYSSH